MSQAGSSGRGGGANQSASVENRKKIAELTARIRSGKPEAILGFGAAVQSRVSQFQDRLMSHVQAKDNRRVIELLGQLLTQLKTLDMSPAGTPSLARRFRAWRKRLSWTELCLSDYRELGQRIERQIDELDDARSQLLADMEIFEKLYAQNLGHLNEVSLRLQVLSVRTQQLEDKELPKIRKRFETHGEAVDGLRVQDLEEQLERLARRKRDLALTREICLQSAGQIRMAQKDRQMLAERILDSVLNAVPLWKTQVSLALVQSRQKETLRLHDRILQATKQVLDRNHSVLRRARVDATRSGATALAGTLREAEPLAAEQPARRETDRLPPRASVPPAPVKPARGLEH
jgi:uncharacterized protein YaaN involved in tellurite resistance